MKTGTHDGVPTGNAEVATSRRSGPTRAPVPRGFLVALAIMPLVVLAAGIWFQRAEVGHLRAEAESQLETIAGLKVEQIALWRLQRLGDAGVLGEDPSLARDAAQALGNSRAAKEALLARFRSLESHLLYDGVVLVDTQGQVRLALDSAGVAIHGDARRAVAEAFRTRRAVLTDLHVGPGSLPAHLDAVAPLFGAPAGSGEPIGAVLLQVHAHRFLYPLISTWPMPSRTAETLLVRRDGDAVLFLNELRHRRHTALELRIPVSQIDLPAARAVLGRRGVMRGRDYRGVDVLSALLPVPDSPWFVVAKVDAAEALAPARFRALLIAGLLGAMVTAALLALLALWQRANKTHYQRLYEAERYRVESEARYRLLFEHMIEGFAHCRMLFENGEPRDFVYLDVNQAFEDLTGLKDVVGRRVTELIPGIRESNPALFAAYGRVASTGAPETFETYVEPLRIWFRVSVYSPMAGHFVAIFDNVTERRRAEEALRESERFARATLDSLAAHIAIVDEGGRILAVNQAWRRFAEENPPLGRPVCEGADYLAACEAATGEDAPVAHAFARGMRAVLAGESVQYSAEYPCHSPNERRWFVGRVTRFLRAGPRRLVVAHENITERRLAEKALLESEGQLSAMFELASVGIAQANPATGRWVRVNQKLCDITGYSAEEMLKLQIPDITHPDDRQVDSEAFQRVVRGEAPSYRIEKRYLRKDGTATWVNVNMTVIRDNAGRPLRTMATVEDINERKAAERALGESEAFTRAVLDNLPVGIAVNSVDPLVEFSYMNDNFTKFYRTTREALADPDAFWDAIYEDPNFRSEIRRRVLDDCARGDPEGMHWEEVPITRHGQETSYISARNIPVPGRPLVISTVWDVTERKRAEEALVLAHARLRRFVDSNIVGALIATAKGEIIEANDYYLRLIGFSRDELLRGEVDWRAITPPEWLPADERALQELRERGTCTPYEKEYQRRDGTRVPVLLVDALLPGPLGEIAAFALDLTERKRAEHALRESEQRYRTVAEFTYDWEYWRGPDGRLLYISPSCERLTGYPPSAFVGDPGLIDRIVHPGDRAAVEAHHAGAAAQAESRSSIDFRIIRSDGSECWMNHSCLPVFGEDGKGLGRRASNRDVTDRKRAEAERDALARQRQLALKAAHLGWWHYDPVSKVATWDDRYREIFEVSGYESPYEEILKRVHPDDLPHVWAEIGAALDPTDPQPYSATYRISHPDGALRWVEAHGLATFEGSGPARRATSFVGTVQDVTERRQLSDELEQRVRERTAQLEAANEEIESFAYSVSHDLRAPLRGIDGWSLAVLEDCSDRLDDQGRLFLSRVRSEAQRMGQLIDHMLALSRVARAEMQSAPVDLSTVALATFDRLRAADGERQVDLRVEPGLLAHGDPALLEVALANLLGNAWKFSAKRTPARIEVGRLEVDGQSAFFVRDNGAGFDMAYSHKLFGAFQRLHRSSEFPGSGIGLATVQRVVHRHGGRVWAEAQVDQGATFYFTLPEAV